MFILFNSLAINASAVALVILALGAVETALGLALLSLLYKVNASTITSYINTIKN
jgi:NADH:ubiquinone oxidoreductase subunit K